MVETFHGYPVLGKLKITSAADRVAILDAIQNAKKPDPTNVECFDPHHGVRLTRNGTTIDYVICFYCTQYDEYLDDLPTASQWQIDENAKSVLNTYLQKARIPQREILSVAGWDQAGSDAGPPSSRWHSEVPPGFHPSCDHTPDVERMRGCI
jgi:hypothetical protein